MRPCGTACCMPLSGWHALRCQVRSTRHAMLGYAVCTLSYGLFVTEYPQKLCEYALGHSES